MAKIRKLEGNIVNQIAAGEVVIQPCSVIKELVENAMDAGASRIEVKFDGGGADSLQVIDDGMGMDGEDLALCIESHATSKIQNAADLYRVTSCGFRGEALASIAEVSHFEIVSRTDDGGGAHRLHREAGKDLFRLSPASRDRGTTVSVKNLFHNVPVRRRFLKSDRSEASNNIDALKKLALARPWIGMRVTRDDKLIFDLAPDQDLVQRLRDLGLFEKEVSFLDFDRERGDLKVHGCVTAPPTHFGSGQKVMVYVNRRPIKDKAVAQALVRAFSSYIPERRFPAGVIFIDIDPEEVDVNIHPTKSEVRFREPDQIFKTLYGCVKDLLQDSAQELDGADRQTLVYKSSGVPKTVPMNRRYGGVYENRPNPFGAPNSSRPASPPISPAPEIEAQSHGRDSFDAAHHLQPRFPNSGSEGRFQNSEFSGRDDPSESGGGDNNDALQREAPLPQTFALDKMPKAVQLLNRFILLEHDDHFELMDQHAIHERILYNQLSHEDRQRHFVSQHLLSPVCLPLPPEIENITELLLEEFSTMGYLLEKGQAEDVVRVAGVPDFLSVEKALGVLEEMLDDLSAGFPPEKDDLRRHILHSAACRSAIKAGDALSEDELQGIVAATLTMDLHQGCCPHGRNARWRISISEANAMFNR